MINDLDFLEISKAEQDIIQQREQYLFSTYYEANKDNPVINLSEYKHNLNSNFIDFNKWQNYNNKINRLQNRRYKLMMNKIKQQLKIIKKLNYKFLDYDTVNIGMSDFGIASRFPFIENGFEIFYVYSKTDREQHLDFKHRGEVYGKDEIICLNKINSSNKKVILKITDAINSIYYMLRNFKSLV